MKIISIITWSTAHKAVALVYAPTSGDLGTIVRETELDAGSLAYVGNGNTYVYDGSAWNKLGG